MIELSKVLEERYKAQKGIEIIDKDNKFALLNFKKDKRNELTDLFKKLGIEDSLELFKTKEGCKVKAYWFYDEELQFINKLYDDYSGALIAVRKQQFMDLDDEYAVWLYDNIFKLFTHRNMSYEEAYEKTVVTYNILDYPVRKRQIAISQLQIQIGKITSLIMEERLRNITSRNDDYAWIDYVGGQIKKSVNEYIHLYDVMYRLRKDELSEYGEMRYNELSQEELDSIDVEEGVALRAYAKWKYSSEVKELLEEQRKIKGEPENPFESGNNTIKKNFTLKETKRLKKIDDKLNELLKETIAKVQKENLAERDLQPMFKKQIGYWAKGMRTSEQLLKDALAQVNNQNDSLGV